MLNVAVSRARDAFIVFGDMHIFVRGSVFKPSAFLANLLFSACENDVTNVSLKKSWRQLSPRDLYSISGTEEHRYAFRDSLLRAKERVRIFSPFITLNAILDDQIAVQISEAIARGVKVEIYYDPNGIVDPLNTGKRAISELEKTNVKLFKTKQFHNKTLIVDDKIYIEGSFNWLSAVRRASRNPNFESSLGYEGDKVKDFIKKTMSSVKPIRDDKV